MAYVISGISFPFRLSGAGLPMPAKGVEVVRSALIVLLKTPRYSRVMRPTVGTSLSRIVFENNGPVIESLVRREILSTISDWLPQVQVVSMDFVVKDKLFQVNVFYRIQGVSDETGYQTVGVVA